MAKNSKLYKTGNDVIDYKSELEKLEEEYHGKDGVLGLTSLTVPSYMSSNRTILFASHMKQFKTLKFRELPKLRTNYEDVVGSNSSFLHKVKFDGVVTDKIVKFASEPNAVYFMIFYSEIEDKYYLEIKKQGIESQERFGFHINNDIMDKLSVGSKVHVGDTLWKSNSYDDDDLYGFGINARCTWLIDNWTIEDALKVRAGFAEKCTSYEEETVEISLNRNDYFVNVHGDSKEYLGIPDIGSVLKSNIVCATRKRDNSRALYDMKESNLREIFPLDDRIYYSKCKEHAIVWDIDIFCNEPMENGVFVSPELNNKSNDQLLRYLNNQRRFYTELHDRLQEIIESGSNYDDDIGFWFKRSQQMLDPKSAFFKDDNRIKFCIIRIRVEREVKIDIGNKITGRYGNKGVVSIIVPDEQMPFTIDENGNKVPLDIVFNVLGIPNRLITMPLYEAEFTGSAENIRKMLNKLPIKEKEDLFFHFMSFFNDRKMFTKLCEYYNNLKDKEEFWDSIRDDGIYIQIPPMWEKEILYDRLKRLYSEIPECNPKQDVYINKFGRTIKMMNKLVVGYLYIIILKQTSKKGFSARSLGFINMKGLPDKTDRMRNNLQLYSSTPIKNGLDDCNNMNIGVSSEDIAKMHLMYRNSVIGRREWKKLLTDDALDFEKFEIDESYTNRNVEILNAYLMCRGQGIVFPGDTIYVNGKWDGVECFLYDNKYYLCSPKEMRERIINDYLYEKFKDKIGSITPEKWEKIKEEEMNSYIRKMLGGNKK